MKTIFLFFFPFRRPFSRWIIIIIIMIVRQAECVVITSISLCPKCEMHAAAHVANERRNENEKQLKHADDDVRQRSWASM